MEELSEDFYTFVDDRVYDNFKKLKNNSKYKELEQNYNESLEKLRDTIKDESLDNLIGLINSLSSQEIFFSYLVGLTDGLQIKKIINNH